MITEHLKILHILALVVDAKIGHTTSRAIDSLIPGYRQTSFPTRRELVLKLFEPVHTGNLDIFWHILASTNHVRNHDHIYIYFRSTELRIPQNVSQTRKSHETLDTSRLPHSRSRLKTNKVTKKRHASPRQSNRVPNETCNSPTHQHPSQKRENQTDKAPRARVHIRTHRNKNDKR